MPGRIDNIDAMIMPLTGGSSRCDGDTALAFLLHPIHGGVAIMDLSHPVHTPRVVEDTLGRRRLARVDMGSDADVPRHCDTMRSSHGLPYLKAGTL